ncbi:MAG: 3-deoxy-manno-octulosonate cytidylyltransferase [Gammaproteobacteria bacterium]
MAEFHVVIPARYASTRLPGKPLRLIGPYLLVEHVYRAALKSGAASVVVATDDDRVQSACEARDIDVCMTATTHKSGTDRCAEIAALRGWDPATIVVNVQGDEPLVPPTAIALVANILADADMATLATPIRSTRDLEDPNRVKVVCSEAGRALYFSRAPIPWRRDRDDPALPVFAGALHHIGLYAYKVSTLQKLTAMPPCELETVEALEQLRALVHGMQIQVGQLDTAPGPGVDTEADLLAVTQLLSAGSNK